MIRLACLLQLVVLGIALSMVVRTNGQTATAQMLVAGPCFLLGLALYGVALLRSRGRNAALSNHSR
jgi:hypothetical protein